MATSLGINTINALIVIAGANVGMILFGWLQGWINKLPLPVDAQCLALDRWVAQHAGMSNDERVDPRRLHRTAVDLWFAVERMKRGNPEGTLPPPRPDLQDDDRGHAHSGSGVPRQPAPMGGEAAAALSEEDAE